MTTENRGIVAPLSIWSCIVWYDLVTCFALKVFLQASRQTIFRFNVVNTCSYQTTASRPYTVILRQHKISRLSACSHVRSAVAVCKCRSSRHWKTLLTSLSTRRQGQAKVKSRLATKHVNSDRCETKTAHFLLISFYRATLCIAPDRDAARCLSVRPSITILCFIKTAEHIVEILSTPGRPIIL